MFDPNEVTEEVDNALINGYHLPAALMANRLKAPT
jgi:hypothetical protein